MPRSQRLNEILERLDSAECRHRKYGIARDALSRHAGADGPPRCVVCGPPYVGKTKLISEVFAGDETAIVVPAPTGSSSGRRNPAMELLEAACQAGGAPMIDGFIDPEPVQPALPFPDFPVERPRRFGQSWESSEQVALRGFSRMVKHRGHRCLVLDGAERMLDAAVARRRVPWLMGLAEEAGIRLVLVCRDHAAAGVVGNSAYGGDFAQVRLQRYDPREVEDWFAAVEKLLSVVPEIRTPDLPGECLGKFFRHSLGCFGLLHEQLRQAIEQGSLKRRRSGSWRMKLTQASLDSAARPVDALGRLLRTVVDGEEQISLQGRLLHTGEDLDAELGLYEAENSARQPSRGNGNGIHRRRPGERTPTREVGNREFAGLLHPNGAGN